MGRTKAYNIDEVIESKHIGTVEPDHVLEDGSTIYCLPFINGAIKKYGSDQDVYIDELFKYIEDTAVEYIGQFYKKSHIGDVKITQTDKRRMGTVEPVYLINKEGRLRNMDLAFIYGALQKYDKDDIYDKIELLNYIIKMCEYHFNRVERINKIKKKREEMEGEGVYKSNG